MYDAIVVGARCSGSPAAMLLAQRGYKVLMLDRGKFPSDKKLSTHYLLPNAVAALQRFGVLDKIKLTDSQPLSKTLVDWGNNRFVSPSPPVDGIRDGYCIRRYILDQLLVERALEQGVEFREFANVEDLIFENRRVVGVKYKSERGKLIEERARIVIGADGLFSQVAKRVEAKRYNEVPTQSAVCFSYFRNVEIEAGITIYLRPDRLLVMGKTNNDLVVIQDYLPVHHFQKFKTDLAKNFMEDFRRYTPHVHDAISQGERVEDWIATGNQPNFFRTPMGPGWALVGDAALHHDSNNPTGITYAFLNTEKMVSLLDQVLSGKKSEASALEEFEAWRAKRWGAHYQFLTQNAEPRPPDGSMYQLLEIMAKDPYVAYEFLGFFNGNEEYNYFFNPDNLAKIFQAHEREANVLQRISTPTHASSSTSLTS